MIPTPGGGAAQAPPFVLPGEHFGLAFAFFVAGALGVVGVAPQLTAGAFPAPAVIGVTHLFTLGWITTSIMGALYQFLPVALGHSIRSQRLAHVTFALHVTGVVLFVAGVVSGRNGLLLPGVALLALGVIIFVGNVAATLARATKRDVTWWGLAAALVFLAVTLVLGATLAGNLRAGYLGASRFHVVAIHLHIALGGWVLLTIVGVAQKLLPMFLLTHDGGTRLAWLAVGSIAAGSAWLALLHHVLPSQVWWVAGLLLGTGVLSFIAQALRFYLRRHRPALDPGMSLAAAGLSLLGIGVFQAVPVALLDAGPRPWVSYVATVVLAISLFVAALYFKIIPFLVWFHRFGPVASQQSVPRVAELYSAKIAWVAAVAMTLGVCGLVGSIQAGWATGARLGGVIMTAGVVAEGTQMLLLSRRQPS